MTTSDEPPKRTFDSVLPQMLLFTTLLMYVHKGDSTKNKKKGGKSDEAIIQNSINDTFTKLRKAEEDG